MEDGMIAGVNQLATPSYLVAALAVNGGRKTKHVVKWALDKFVPEGILLFKLFFIRPKITRIPTPSELTFKVGSVPISQVREDVAIAYKKEVEWQTYEQLLPFKNMCAMRKVEVQIVQIESDDVVDAIKNEIVKNNISKLVIGASSKGMFSRGQNLSSRISESIPSFCTVYVVSKGKLSSLRASDSETIASSKDDSNSSDSGSITNSSSLYPSSQTEWTDQGSATSYSQSFSNSLPMQRFEALSSINRTLVKKTSSEGLGNKFLDSCEGDDATVSNASNPDYAQANNIVSSDRSFLTEYHSWSSDQDSISDAPSENSFEIKDNSINFELEKLRVELRHIRGMYAIAQSETLDASRRLSEVEKLQLEESVKLEALKVKEEEAKLLAEQEKKQREDAKRLAEYAKDCLRREVALRKEVEDAALQDSREKQKLQKAITGTSLRYQEFTWEEIEAACSSFSEDLKIGTGGNGTVYKSSFHHMVAAVKVLHSQEAHRTKQFQQELEVLSRIRHPHLLILIGACVDHGCLVYEYMENGSLEERLFRKNDTPPIPWFDRFRITWEVASALIFLHNAKPKSIVHRDLKPANILLDQNLVSKIGDVGLSTMLQSDFSSTSTVYKDTSPAGTLCYIDPEYQRTGLVSPKSDVYALGMVILQLLTARPAIAVTHVVETALENDELASVLDPDAGEWPIDETKELAILGLSCAELRRKDRPDLKNGVLPVLERLKAVADEAQRSTSMNRPTPPNHFICPILKDSRTRLPLLHGQVNCGVYELRSTQSPRAFSLQFNKGSLWHHRLGHPNLQTLSFLASSHQSISKFSNHCHSCSINKMHKLPFHESSMSSNAPLQLLFSDLWSSPVPSYDGFKYYIIFIDHYTKYIWIYPLKSTADSLQTFIRFQRLVENFFQTKIKQFFSDNGGEFIKMASHFASCGISHLTSPPHTPEHNGYAERRHRHIIETGLSLLSHATLPLSFWPLAFINSYVSD